MIRSEIRSRIRKKLGETTAVFWTDAELNSNMEDAQKDIVWKAKLKRTRGTFTTTATARYVLTTILPRFMRVCDGGVYIYDLGTTDWTKVTYRTKDDMVAQYGDGWVNADAATPIHYMEDLDENIIELWPTPQTSNVGTDYCRVHYCATPTAMSIDAATPDLDAQGLLHPAIVDHVVATGFESRGYWDIANDVWAKYYDKIKSYMVEKNTKEDEDCVTKNYRNL